MKKIFCLCALLCVLLTSLCSCVDNSKVIKVGASPSPHTDILSCKAVTDYIESKGYRLQVIEFEDYIMPNIALNDKTIDANYFQHIPYLEQEKSEKNYQFSAACEVHNEPLNLYGKTKKTEWNNTTIYITNDKSNVERAYKLLVANGIIDTYSVENFDADYPVFTSSIGATVKCLDPGLLRFQVEDGGYAVIPGNFALNAWGTNGALEYKILGETTQQSLPNIIAVRTEDLNSEKIRVLVEALSQEAVKEYIEQTYGVTVNYLFKSYLPEL